MPKVWNYPDIVISFSSSFKLWLKLSSTSSLIGAKVVFTGCSFLWKPICFLLEIFNLGIIYFFYAQYSCSFTCFLLKFWFCGFWYPILIWSRGERGALLWTWLWLNFDSLKEVKFKLKLLCLKLGAYFLFWSVSMNDWYLLWAL